MPVSTNNAAHGEQYGHHAGQNTLLIYQTTHIPSKYSENYCNGCGHWL